MNRDPLEPAEKRIYKLISVSLTPLYFDSGLLETADLKPAVDKIYAGFKKTGIVTSRTDEAAILDNRRSVGYDYGLILYSMLSTGTKGAEDLYMKTLSIVDETGAWSEYYIDDVPSGTRCRPWESAINLEALIRFAREY